MKIHQIILNDSTNKKDEVNETNKNNSPKKKKRKSLNRQYKRIKSRRN